MAEGLNFVFERTVNCFVYANLLEEPEYSHSKAFKDLPQNSKNGGKMLVV